MKHKLMTSTIASLMFVAGCKLQNNGNATMKFYANYIALADGVQPGLANADATFLINYN